MTIERLIFAREHQPPAPAGPSEPVANSAAPQERTPPPAPGWAIGAIALILGVASLPDSAAPPWRGDLITVASGALTVLVAGLAAMHRLPLVPSFRHLAPSLVFIAVVFIWVLFQASALPGAFWGGALYHPIWRLAADALPAAPAGAISLDPSAGMAGLLVLLRCIAMIWIAFQLATESRRARHLLLTIIVIGAASLAGTLAGHSLAPQAAGDRASPVVAGLCLLAVVTLWLAQRAGGSAPDPTLPRQTAGRLRKIVAWPWWPVLAVLFFTASLLIAAGPTGIIAALLGSLAFLIAIAAAPSLAPLRRRMSLALSLALVLGALLVELSAASGRIDASPAFDPRGTTLHAVAAQAIADAPLLGTGYGTFAAVAHLYGAAPSERREAGPGFYLQTMVELGVPAGTALVLAGAGLFVLCAQGVRWRRRNAIFPCLGIGASALIASDAAIGTSPQDPLPALIWCLVMGVACAQSLPTSERQTQAQKQA